MGGVCQNMWDAAGNNMVIGTDLNVDPTSATNLFTLTATGEAKLQSTAVYAAFKGKRQNIMPSISIMMTCHSRRLLSYATDSLKKTKQLWGKWIQRRCDGLESKLK